MEAAPRRHKDKCPPDIGGGALGKAQAAGRLVGGIHPRWKVQAKKAATLEPYYPGHVRACVHNQLPGQPWFLHTWNRDEPGNQVRTPYVCNSYRCPSVQCQRAAAHRDFARIDAAMKGATGGGLAPDGFVFLVLTIDQQDHFRRLRKPYRHVQECFKRLSNNTRFFLRRLRRRQRAMGWRETGNEWVATVEVQRNGWPHLNLIVYAPELADELRAEAAMPWLGHKSLVKPGTWLFDAVVETNWGTISTAEAARDQEALAGYVTKVAGEFGRTIGEVSKITQAPVNARCKLRRIRAGKGFLPPQGAQRRDGSRTGVMMRRQVHWGHLVAGPMLEPDQVRPVGDTPEEQRENFERYAAGVRRAMARERDEISAELELAKHLVGASQAQRYLVQLASRAKKLVPF